MNLLQIQKKISTQFIIILINLYFTNSNKKPIALCNGENVQFDKNLEQNNIKDDSSVVLVIQDENESESMQNQLMQQQMISQQNMQESMMSMMANQISQQQVQMEKMLNSNCGNQKQQGTVNLCNF